MIKKTIKFADYNGQEREMDFYFNLSKAELSEMELSVAGGLGERIKRIAAAQDTPEIIKIFKELILKSYGVKSDDGLRFIKSEQLSKEFEQTEAYSVLFMELASDDKKAAEFINGIIPSDMKSQLSKQIENKD